MKKILMIGLAATAMLTSCSNDENVEMPAQKNAIAFSSFVNKSTRATDIDNTNISNFSVYGFIDNASGVIFDKEAVTGSGTGAGGNWTYANTQYWTPSKSYYFTAIAPTTDAAWTFAPLTGDATGQGGTISLTNAGTQDLLYAYQTATTPATITTAPAKVAFEFNHLLSRVKFNFTNAMGNANTTLKITSVKITDANTKASINVAGFNMASSAWTLADDNTKTAFDFGAIADAIANNGNKDTNHMYLIPQNQKYTMEFVVEVYAGNVLIATYNHTGDNAVEVPAVDMKLGHSYVFKAELNGKNINPNEELYPIVFNVEKVNVWEDWEPNNATIGE